jgi:hypothetical protein
MKADKQHAKKRARKLFASVLFRQTAELVRPSPAAGPA